MMPSLPLPLVSALVLAFLLAVLLLRRERPGLFVALVGLCALQATAADGRTGCPPGLEASPPTPDIG